MRAAPIGVFPSIEEVIEKCRIQAALTHNTLDGMNAAVAVALSTHYFLYRLGSKLEWVRFLGVHVPGRWSEPWSSDVGDKGWIGARGLTWPHLIKFTNSPGSFDEWAAIHELGHAWDANFGWRLSKGLEEFTGGHTDRVEWYEKLLAGQCDPDQRLPGCNNAGYFYRGSPPAGSNWRFNRKEDFGESVVGYVHEDWVRAEVERFADDPQLRRFLYYRNYTHTLRWAYIDGLINGTITIH